jgi:hypothetical protein
MDAYQYLRAIDDNHLIDEETFYQLIIEFQNSYLQNSDYQQRVLRHRDTEEVSQDLLKQLYDYDHAIQYRPDMRDDDEVNKTFSFIPSVIKEMWKSDKHLKTLYRTVQAYCQLRNKDFNTIAVHIAEFRAIIRLEARARRDIRRYQASEEKLLVKYTFEDWLKNRFYQEKGNSCEFVANDSENYLELVSAGKMTMEDLNKIQAAQQLAYNYLIDRSLRLNEQQFSEQTKNSQDVKQVIAEEMDKIGKYFNENVTILNEVMLPRKYQTIDWGAKYLLPEHYNQAVEKRQSHINNLQNSTYQLNINGNQTSFPTPEQWKYVVMEVQARWLTILHGYRSEAQYEQMVNSPDFKSLINNYGGGEDLMNDYRKCLDFAPDREVIIKDRIKTYESIMAKPKASIVIRDWQTKQEVRIETGEYKGIGYAWVNGGYNGQSSDFRTMTLRNITLCPDVAAMQRFGVYVQVLHNLAVGGAIAFHLAFLRNELKTEAVAPPKSPRSTKKANSPLPVWQGTEAQREMLYEALVEELFIEDSPGCKSKFMNNQPVKWLQDARALYYMLKQLKEKKYKVLIYSVNWVPLVNANFVDRQGEKFKSVNQNISGMKTANRNGRPRQADAVDAILKRLVKP